MSSQALQSAATATFAGLFNRPDLKDELYLSWLRCSGDSQIKTSPEGQKVVNDSFAGMQGMRWVGEDVYAEGVSGSQTFNRSDILELIDACKRLKCKKVVLFEYSRSTRGGIRHGFVVEDELKKHGIELISSTELIPPGPMGDLIKAIKHFCNQQQAMNISLAVARGLALSLAKKTRPASSCTPQGLDRMYIGPNGQPRVIVRWEGRTQYRLDPKTLEVIGSVVCPPRRKRRKQGERKQHRENFEGYRRQSDEISVFIPSAPHIADVYRYIFRLFHIEKMGAHRIIRKLNENKMKSHFGSRWQAAIINYILQNPIYTGVEVRHRYTSAIYTSVDENGPIPVSIDQDKIAEAGYVSIPRRERSRDEWKLVDVPHMKDFLPEDVRPLAIAYIKKLYDRDEVVAKQARTERRNNKADINLHVLSNILENKHSHNRMRGTTMQRKLASGTKPRRFYVDQGMRQSGGVGVHAKMVRADPLEDAIMPVILGSFSDVDWIESRIREAVDGLDTSQTDCENQQQSLTDERDQITRRLTRIHRTSDGLTDDELQDLVRDDNARLVAIRAELTSLEQSAAYRPPTIDEAVSAVRSRIKTIPSDWKSIPCADMKQLLRVIIRKLEIDLPTFEVTAEVVVPRSALSPLQFQDGKGECLSLQSAVSLLTESHSTGAIKIADIHCKRVVTSPIDYCYSCHRLPKAA